MPPRDEQLQPPGVMLDPLPRIEEALREAVSLAGLPESLTEAIAYASLDGGKRVRPVLAWHACSACGADPTHALPACCALELIHCFSLVHDDLPAMDDDDLRRGKPTLHVARGEAMAILAGDAMLPIAFMALAGAPLDPSTIVALSSELARATQRMIAGQVHDTHGGLPGELSDAEQVALIHKDKTGALLEASCRMGAISAGASAKHIASLGAYGAAIGAMFQLVDDLLDVERSSEETGKRTGKDAPAGKLTAITAFGAPGVRDLIRQREREALDALAGIGTEAEPLREIARWLAIRGR